MRVYISGPYSKGDGALNVRTAIEAGNRVALAGHYPFIPHLTHFWHLVCPNDWHFWMEQDKEWLKVCEAIIRLSGESKGADIETGLAESLGIPVYHSIDEFLEKHPC